jgi:hypothetical protein
MKNQGLHLVWHGWFYQELTLHVSVVHEPPFYDKTAALEEEKVPRLA